MSISPAQIVLQAASAEIPAVSGRSTPGSVPAATAAAESPAQAPVVTSSPQFSTDLRVDNEHQIYYEFIDASTGDVMFEIPPEALREIGESLNLPLAGDASVPSVDVNS